MAARLTRLTRLSQQWSVPRTSFPRRASTQGSAGGSTSLNIMVIGGTVLAGAIGYSYWRHNSSKPPSVGLHGAAKTSVLQKQKSDEYQKEGAQHPEAVAEKSLETKEKTPVSVVPPVAMETIVSDIPGYAPYVLIGAGTASFAAARGIREKDPTAKVLIIGNEEYTPYSRPPLSKQLWFYEDHEAAKQLKFKASWSGGKEVDVFYKANFCSPKDLPTMEEGGIAVVTGHKVTSLDPKKRNIVLDNGHQVTYDKCLLATGGRPRTLPIFDKKGPISTYRTIPDYQSLDALLDKVNSVLVVGGGFLGSELAVALASRGKEKGVSISQVFPEVGNLGLVLPKDVSQWTTDKVRKEGVQVYPSTSIKETAVNDGKVTVTTSNGTELVADHVVVAVGLEPNTELAKSARLETDPLFGGFKVNSELQACTGVWAAGDVASFYDPYLGRRRVEHHDHANVSGKLAGYNMTGAHEQFLHQSMFWSDVGPDVGFEATGWIDAKLPTVGVWGRKSSETVDTPQDDYSKGVIYYLEKEEGRIVGVLTFNMFGKMDVARQIISEEKRESDIGDLSQHFELH